MGDFGEAIVERLPGQVLIDATPGPRPGISPCKACAVRHMAVCDALATDELHYLKSILTQGTLAAGDDLIYEGDEADCAFIVTSGVVKLYKLLPDGRCQVVGFAFPGDFLGLSDTHKYSCSVEAVTSARFCRFKKTDMEALLDRIPHLQKRMLEVTRFELSTVQEQMLLLGRKLAKEKIASFLLSLSRRAARSEEPISPVYVPMRRSDVADYLGLTTETVSRSFTQLRKDGLISPRASGWVDLHDVEKLKVVAEGY